MSTALPFVREEDLSRLMTIWDQIAAGTPRLALIEGEEGSGRGAMVGALLQKVAAPDVFPIRVQFPEGEDGLRVLLRLYAGVYGALHKDAALKAAVEAHVDELLAAEGLGESMSLWLKAFKEGLGKEAPESEAATFQVTIPRASPYQGLIELLLAFGKKFRIVLELGDSQQVLSFPFWIFMHSLVGRLSRSDARLLLVMWHPTQPDDEFSPALLRSLLTSLPEGLAPAPIVLAPLTAEQLAAHVATRYAALALPPAVLDQLVVASQGRPDWADQILARLEESRKLSMNGEGWKLDPSMVELDLASLMPPLPAADEAKLRRALQVAALEGRTFTASVVSDALELGKDEIDDLLDELEGHIEEVVFHEGLKTWLYRFRTPLLHRHMLGSLSDHARQEQARVLAELLEKRYVGRAPEFAYKASRLWREAGEGRRAANVLGVLTAVERPDVLQMGYEIYKADHASTYGTLAVRGLHLSLAEKLSNNGPVALGMDLMNSLANFAASRNVEDLGPWIALYRARFLLRNNQIPEAEKFAEEARAGFAKARNPVKEAEALVLLAGLELRRGELGKVLEYSQRVLKDANFPPVVAQARFLKGVVLKARGDLQGAVEDLRVALETSARVGNLALHADAGLNLAETLIMGNNAPAALQLLGQLRELTRQQKMAPQERGCLALTSKAHGALKDYRQATQAAQEALKMARALKIRLAEASDLFDLGLYSYLDGQIDEAQIYLKEADNALKELNFPPLKAEIQFHLGLVASAQEDLNRARDYYLEAEKACRQTGNERRMANILFNLGAIYLHLEQVDKARSYIEQSRPLVEKYGTEEEKKALRKASRKLENMLH